MGLVGDTVLVHGQDAVPDLQLPTAVRWAAFNDPPYFVGHGHTCIASYGHHSRVVHDSMCMQGMLLFGAREREKRKGRKRGKGSREEEKKIQGYIVESTASESQSHRDKL